ncbi:hypothetical protein GCM10022406_23090 [Hymenobacter algoricola]|uniref:Secretion system C-terminal sorting domain-containing protein n=1 Tax=Hymenobacter algoricola TaxID=486267 RepID=A0ABP7N792_9BACT
MSAALLAGLSSPTLLQAQALDPTFQPTVLKTPLAPGIQLSVNALAVQPDGKVLAAGGFDFVNGNLTGKLQRFNVDGTTDATFNVGGTGANAFLSAVLLQPDGKILVGGGFTTFNGQPRSMVVRLNPDGSLDNSFTFGSSASVRQITRLALQSDGKILVASGPSLQRTPETGGVVRLNADGSVDSSFSVGTGNTQGTTISVLLVQADGKILVGGSFVQFNGQACIGLVRLTSSGAIDPDFMVTNTNYVGSIFSAAAQQPDGKLLVGGSFTQLNGQPAPFIARLLADGTSDNTFQPTPGPNNSVRNIVLEPNGNILIAGSFNQVSGVSRGRIARLTPNGSLDPAFATGTGIGSSSNALALTPAGQVLLAGGFTQYNGVSYGGLVRLNAVTGQPDATFAPVIEARGIITRSLPLSNGQLLVSGNFTQFNGAAVPGSSNSVRRINADGSLDGSFTTPAAGTLQAVQSNGSFYVFTGPTPGLVLRRYLADGTLDNSFTAQTFGVGSPSVGPLILQGVVALPNGQLFVHGLFISYGSRTGLSGLIRLNADGTPDNAFVPATAPADRRVLQVLTQPGGKLVVVADVVNTFVTTVSRLNANGSADNSFSVGTAAGTGANYAVLLQPDGRLLVSGAFTSFNGQATPYGLTRLTADGAADPTYSGLAGFYSPRLVQPDGHLLATTGNSAFTNAASALVRLNTDGSLDASFNPVATPLSIFTGDDAITGVVLQPTDGKILLFGSFRYIAGQVRIGLARLTNVGVLATRGATATRPLTLYPNPAHQVAHLQLPAEAEARPALLVDGQGCIVRQWTIPARQAEATVNLEAVPAGVYLLRVQGAAAVYQQRLVVTH